ncbi:MAG: 16S rRNA (cytidine(1402)-2'-O)-methyltransferase [Verrucomicrobiota bacterium]|nr:16S rRNA (cytidine(1402)-2'-O)-methyltransferase [Verrucomicrobiota bacterium]
MASLSAVTPVGVLHVVATPIGNLGDISARAVEVLKTCSVLACEDTRSARHLLDPIGASPRMIAYHEHNEAEAANGIADLVAAGESVAIISEAGTPAISDPGFRVVRECRKRGLRVSPVPGACAAVTALSASGLPSDGFLYLGFLQPKSSARVRAFQQYQDFEYTLIFYESTHRIEKFLDDLLEVMGPDRVVCVARELTKLYETIFTGRLVDVIAQIKTRSTKGEFVVLIAKKDFTL